MATKMSKAMYGKTMMKSGGTKKLVKKNMGGSGMGRMAADDAAYESMMNTSTTTPATKPMLDPSVKAKLAEAAANRRNAVQGETMSGAMNASMQSMPPNKKNGGATKTTYKTGGMVNANAKLVANKSAGSKGVKVKVNPKAAASSTAKKPSKPRSKAPKKATPGRK